MDAATLCNKLYDETVHQARWNSEVTDIHVRPRPLLINFIYIDNIICCNYSRQILKRIDDDTDLIYIASSKPPGGMIQQR